MTTILALDLGSRMGWAVNNDGVIRSGMEDFTLSKGEHKGKRYNNCRKWIKEMIYMYEPDMVYYEMPHMRGKHATQALHGYLTCLQMATATYGINIAEVHSGTLKKFATGYGKASKEDMIIASEMLLGTEGQFTRKITDDNEADAICLLKYAESQIGGKSE